MPQRAARRDDVTLSESIAFAHRRVAEASFCIRRVDAQLRRTEDLIHRIRDWCDHFEPVRTEPILWEAKP